MCGRTSVLIRMEAVSLLSYLKDDVAGKLPVFWSDLHGRTRRTDAALGGALPRPTRLTFGVPPTDHS
jgi:hypothetical protein